MSNVHLVVLGAGPGGYSAAFYAADQGYQVTLVDASDKLGGVLTGEHGVGVEKRELMCDMFSNNDIQQQIKIKRALASSSLLNPGKVYPILRKCAEEGRVHVHRGKTKFANIPRF